MVAATWNSSLFLIIEMMNLSKEVTVFHRLYVFVNINYILGLEFHYSCVFIGKDGVKSSSFFVTQ